MTSTAFLTDRYELTMLEAALRSGRASCPATFEVFTRRIPERRPWGVFAGLGRFTDALLDFHFGPEELSGLEEHQVVDAATAAYLASYHFSGRIDAYREGELYTAGSPVLTVEASFGEGLLLETLALSILNFDSAVAGAASLITIAAGGRPVIEMGSRRVDPNAAVAAARAAYIGGFASTSNLQAGRLYGIPTAGTASHAFVLAYPSETEAFAAQVAAFGPGTTLLVDTYDPMQGIRNALEVAGPGLGAVRIDSGDLGLEALRARKLLDELGASQTKLVVTGDLEARTIAALGAAPVDSFGVGTNVVTGMGAASAGFVYKLVSVGDPGGGPGAPQRPVAKRSAGKATVGGRKWAWRGMLHELPGHFALEVLAEGKLSEADLPAWADIVATSPECPHPGAEELQVRAVDHGEVVHSPSLAEVRAYHAATRERTGWSSPLLLDRHT
jgi:nicotinate phosphoribosyltransferase